MKTVEIRSSHFALFALGGIFSLTNLPEATLLVEKTFGTCAKGLDLDMNVQTFTVERVDAELLGLCGKMALSKLLKERGSAHHSTLLASFITAPFIATLPGSPDLSNILEDNESPVGYLARAMTPLARSRTFDDEGGTFDIDGYTAN